MVKPFSLLFSYIRQNECFHEFYKVKEKHGFYLTLKVNILLFLARSYLAPVCDARTTSDMLHTRLRIRLLGEEIFALIQKLIVENKKEENLKIFIN